MAYHDPTQTRYFQLDTRDTNGNPQIYYAAWRSPTAILFFINDDGKAQVMFVIPLKVAEQLRQKVQIGPDGHNGGIADVVGFTETSRPNFNDVDLSQSTGGLDAITLGTILEV